MYNMQNTPADSRENEILERKAMLADILKLE